MENSKTEEIENYFKNILPLIEFITLPTNFNSDFNLLNKNQSKFIKTNNDINEKLSKKDISSISNYFIISKDINLLNNKVKFVSKKLFENNVGKSDFIRLISQINFSQIFRLLDEVIKNLNKEKISEFLLMINCININIHDINLTDNNHSNNYLQLKYDESFYDHLNCTKRLICENNFKTKDTIYCISLLNILFITLIEKEVLTPNNVANEINKLLELESICLTRNANKIEKCNIKDDDNQINNKDYLNSSLAFTLISINPLCNSLNDYENFNKFLNFSINYLQFLDKEDDSIISKSCLKQSLFVFLDSIYKYINHLSSDTIFQKNQNSKSNHVETNTMNNFILTNSFINFDKGNSNFFKQILLLNISNSTTTDKICSIFESFMNKIFQETIENKLSLSTNLNSILISFNSIFKLNFKQNIQKIMTNINEKSLKQFVLNAINCLEIFENNDSHLIKAYEKQFNTLILDILNDKNELISNEHDNKLEFEFSLSHFKIHEKSLQNLESVENYILNLCNSKINYLIMLSNIVLDHENDKIRKFFVELSIKALISVFKESCKNQFSKENNKFDSCQICFYYMIYKELLIPVLCKNNTYIGDINYVVNEHTLRYNNFIELLFTNIISNNVEINICDLLEKITFSKNHRLLFDTINGIFKFADKLKISSSIKEISKLFLNILENIISNFSIYNRAKIIIFFSIIINKEKETNEFKVDTNDSDLRKVYCSLFLNLIQQKNNILDSFNSDLSFSKSSDLKKLKLSEYYHFNFRFIIKDVLNLILKAILMKNCLLRDDNNSELSNFTSYYRYVKYIYDELDNKMFAFTKNITLKLKLDILVHVASLTVKDIILLNDEFKDSVISEISILKENNIVDLNYLKSSIEFQDIYSFTKLRIFINIAIEKVNNENEDNQILETDYLSFELYIVIFEGLFELFKFFKINNLSDHFKKEIDFNFFTKFMNCFGKLSNKIHLKMNENSKYTLEEVFNKIKNLKIEIENYLINVTENISVINNIQCFQNILQLYLFMSQVLYEINNKTFSIKENNDFIDFSNNNSDLKKDLIKSANIDILNKIQQFYIIDFLSKSKENKKRFPEALIILFNSYISDVLDNIFITNENGNINNNYDNKKFLDLNLKFLNDNKVDENLTFSFNNYIVDIIGIFIESYVENDYFVINEFSFIEKKSVFTFLKIIIKKCIDQFNNCKGIILNSNNISNNQINSQNYDKKENEINDVINSLINCIDKLFKFLKNSNLRNLSEEIINEIISFMFNENLIEFISEFNENYYENLVDNIILLNLEKRIIIKSFTATIIELNKLSEINLINIISFSIIKLCNQREFIGEDSFVSGTIPMLLYNCYKEKGNNKEIKQINITDSNLMINNDYESDIYYNNVYESLMIKNDFDCKFEKQVYSGFYSRILIMSHLEDLMNSEKENLNDNSKYIKTLKNNLTEKLLIEINNLSSLKSDLIFSVSHRNKLRFCQLLFLIIFKVENFTDIMSDCIVDLLLKNNLSSVRFYTDIFLLQIIRINNNFIKKIIENSIKNSSVNINDGIYNNTQLSLIPIVVIYYKEVLNKDNLQEYLQNIDNCNILKMTIDHLYCNCVSNNCSIRGFSLYGLNEINKLLQNENLNKINFTSIKNEIINLLHYSNKLINIENDSGLKKIFSKFNDLINNTYSFIENKSENKVYKLIMENYDEIVSEYVPVDILKEFKNIAINYMEINNEDFKFSESSWKLYFDLIEINSNFSIKNLKTTDKDSNMSKKIVTKTDITFKENEFENLGIDTNLNNKNENMNYNDNFQLKYVPSFNQRFDVIVVASLLEKIPNLGGITRTCEVFNMGAIVLSSSQILKDPQYLGASSSAEKLLPIIIVPKFNLFNFLISYKKMGYTIIGIEQTKKSINYKQYPFQSKTILIMGNEKSGIPQDLINLVDDAVVIEQYGQVRSLNVHVCTSIIIKEIADKIISKSLD